MGDRNVRTDLPTPNRPGRPDKKPRPRSVRPGVESLEGRQLLSGDIMNFVTLPAGMKAGPMVVNTLGKLYYAESGGTGPATIGIVTSANKQSSVTLPATDTGGAVTGIAADPTGDVWYAYGTKDGAVATVGEITPTGSVTQFPLPHAGDVPGTVALGSDGNIWITVSNANTGASVAQVTPAGKVTEFPVSGAKSLGFLTAAPDKNLWFTDGVKIGKITTAGVETEYNMPSTAGVTVDLSNAQLTPGSDGNMYFLGLGGVSQITPIGTVTTDTTPGTSVTALGTTVDGNLWFSFVPASNNSLSTTAGAVLIRLTPAGATTQVSDRVDTSNTPVTGIVGGPDASLWINDGGTMIKRLGIISIPTFSPPVVYPTTTTALTTDANGYFSGAVVSVTAYDSNATASSLTATIDWGDGKTSSGTVTANQNGGFDVDASHTYAAAAGATENVTVTMTENAISAQVFNRVTVEGAGSTPLNTTPEVVLGGSVKGSKRSQLAAQRKAQAAALRAQRVAAAAARHGKGTAATTA